MAGSVGVVGLGLIGGSIARALAPIHRVVGTDPDPRTLGQAAAIRAVHSTDPQDFAGCEIVFVAVPPHLTPAVLHDLAERTPAILTDCASVKAPLIAQAGGKGWSARYVPGHPMAGKAEFGFAAADPNLFRGAPWILTPTEGTDPAAVSTVERWVAALGARPVHLGAEDHDHHVGLLSHLPHILATHLLRMQTELRHPAVAAGSWRDLTRVGGAHPTLWRDILSMNRTEAARWCRTMADHLAETARQLESENDEAVAEAFREARQAKENLR